MEVENNVSTIKTPKHYQEETIELENTILLKTKEKGEKEKINNDKITIIELDQETNTSQKIPKQLEENIIEECE